MKRAKIIALLKKEQKKTFPNQKEIDKKIAEIAAIEDEINNFMHRTGFVELCKSCLHICCAEFIIKIALSLPEVLYYTAKQNPNIEEEVKKQEFLKDKCPLLTPNGCILNPTGKPKICISYFCQLPYKRDVLPLTNKLGRKFYELKTLLEIFDATEWN